MERNNNVKTSKADYKVNILFLYRFFYILKTANSWLSVILALLILFLCLGQQILVYYVGLLASQFSKVLVDQDSDGFKHVLFRALALTVGVSFANSFVQYAYQTLYLHWRQKMCFKLHKLYFTRYNYYHINNCSTSSPAGIYIVFHIQSIKCSFVSNLVLLVHQFLTTILRISLSFTSFRKF